MKLKTQTQAVLIIGGFFLFICFLIWLGNEILPRSCS